MNNGNLEAVLTMIADGTTVGVTRMNSGWRWGQVKTGSRKEVNEWDKQAEVLLVDVNMTKKLLIEGR